MLGKEGIFQTLLQATIQVSLFLRFHFFLTGFGTNLLTLVLYDWSLSNILPLVLTLAYHLFLCIFLTNFVSLPNLTYLGTAANTLSVNLVPLTILLKHLKNLSTPKEGLVPINHSQFLAAYLKSLIWFSYGVIKCAKPMLVSHSIGIVIITAIYIVRKGDCIDRTKASKKKQ